MDFLIQFSNTFMDFRLAEVESLLVFFGLDQDSSTRILMDDYNCKYPYLKIRLPNRDSALKLASKSVLTRNIYTYLCEGSTFEELFSNIEKLHLPSDYFDEEVSWRFDIDAFGRILTEEEQESYRLMFEPFLPFKGPVKLKNPCYTFCLLMNFCPINSNLRHLYLGIHVSSGQRHIDSKYSLKTRKYIGPTTTCPEIAFLMSNNSLCRPGSLVWDCFVGTGSLLVAATAHGATCVGSDIDVRILTGLKKGVQYTVISDTFHQYNLPVPDLLRIDASSLPLRKTPLFDAIICDPPYGIRAGAKRICSRVQNESTEAHTANSPALSHYDADDVVVDMLDNAAEMLVCGGRLVYLFPTFGPHEKYQVPCHQCLKLVNNCEQGITLNISRRLITMEKVLEYDISKKEEYKKMSRESLVTHAISFCNIMDKAVEINLMEGKTKAQRKDRKKKNTEMYKRG